MFKQGTITLSKQNIYKTAMANGYKANRLSTLLGLEKKGEVTKVDVTKGELTSGLSPRNAYEIMMQPYNISFMTTLLSEGSLLFNTVLASENHYALYNVEAEESKIKLVELEELMDWFMALIESGPKVEIIVQLDWSVDGFYTWLCLIDALKRNHLEQMVMHLIGKPKINEDTLIKEIEIAKENKDLRWLTPFFLDTHSFDKEIDFKAGLKELTSHKLITMSKGEITLTDQGKTQETFWQSYKVISGLQSYFYHKDELTFLSVAFVRTPDGILYFELSDRVHMKSIEPFKVKELLAMIVAPGDNPGEIERIVKKSDKIPKQSTAQRAKESTGQTTKSLASEWRCICGSVNQSAFCKSCGTKRPVKIDTVKSVEKPSFCTQCGTKNPGKAKFCKHCGQAMLPKG